MTPTTSTTPPHPDANREPAGGGPTERWTPGPWTVEGPLGPEILSIVAGGPNAYDWLHVAQLSVDAEPDEMSDQLVIPEAQVKANARLIAAAPDLYAALRAVRKRLADLDADFVFELDDSERNEAAIALADAALARATLSPGPSGADGAAAGGGVL